MLYLKQCLGLVMTREAGPPTLSSFSLHCTDSETVQFCWNPTLSSLLPLCFSWFSLWHQCS